MAYAIYLVEDQDLMRSSMRTYLSSEEDFEVVGTADSGEAALNDLTEASAPPDVVLVDVALPGMSGIELVHRLREAHPDLVCLILSGHAEEAYVEAAHGAGAQGYVMKGKPNEYIRAIRATLAGDSYRSETVASMWDNAQTTS
ncbi:MAG: response regulator transcription factor [Longimonas sp.]|uniref:response regulator n=1 Tax=Longimonas sp. TaxID=2039626 RepID=UPI00397694FF